MGYWEERNALTQQKLTDKSIAETEAQLKRYYKKSLEKVLGQFEKTYNHLFLSIVEGKEPTPADLYKLDTYWQMQGQLQHELEKLGDKTIKVLTKDFIKQYGSIYEAVAIKGENTFNKVNTETARQMINQVWCADGKSWSQRVWTNTNMLREKLNDNLIYCVITGKKPTELKRMLIEDFNVDYRRADTLVRTEMAHIQTQAAKDRYTDYGIKEYEILLDGDNDECDICKKASKEKHLMSEMIVGKNAPPFHPNCRCCVIPVVEKDIKPDKASLK